MRDIETTGFFQLVGEPVRWEILTALSKSDLRVQELVERVGRPQNAVSYHLRQLHEHGLLQEHRSIADGREIYYSLDLERVNALYRSVGEALHPALGAPQGATPDRVVPGKRLRVLFLCTHNSARSQMAEGILRERAHGQVHVSSAGTEPQAVHPMAIRAMAELGIDISRQQSKHLGEYLGQSFDDVITVCDRAREACPAFPGDPRKIHWSIPDPVSVEGDDAARAMAFREIAEEINRRIGYFLFVLQRSNPGAVA